MQSFSCVSVGGKEVFQPRPSSDCSFLVRYKRHHRRIRLVWAYLHRALFIACVIVHTFYAVIACVPCPEGPGRGVCVSLQMLARNSRSVSPLARGPGGRFASVLGLHSSCPYEDSIATDIRIRGPTQLPAAVHVSFVVHSTPSSQSTSVGPEQRETVRRLFAGACLRQSSRTGSRCVGHTCNAAGHCAADSSPLQNRSSLQSVSLGVPEQPPSPSHMSPVVQAIPSVQAAPSSSVIRGKLSESSSHAPSMVQSVGFGSNPLGAVPGLQPSASLPGNPGRHCSIPLQNRPSSHSASVLHCGTSQSRTSLRRVEGFAYRWVGPGCRTGCCISYIFADV